MLCAIKNCPVKNNTNITCHRVAYEKIRSFFGIQDSIPGFDILCQEHYLLFKRDYEEPSTSNSTNKSLEMVPKSPTTPEPERMEVENSHKRKSNSINCEGPSVKKQSIHVEFIDSDSESESEEYFKNHYIRNSRLQGECNAAEMTNHKIENNCEESSDEEEPEESIESRRILPQGPPENRHLPIGHYNEIRQPNINMSDEEFCDKLIDSLQRLPNLERFEAKVRIIQLVEEALASQGEYTNILSMRDFEGSRRV